MDNNLYYDLLRSLGIAPEPGSNDIVPLVTPPSAEDTQRAQQAIDEMEYNATNIVPLVTPPSAEDTQRAQQAIDEMEYNATNIVPLVPPPSAKDTQRAQQAIDEMRRRSEAKEQQLNSRYSRGTNPLALGNFSDPTDEQIAQAKKLRDNGSLPPIAPRKDSASGTNAMGPASSRDAELYPAGGSETWKRGSFYNDPSRMELGDRLAWYRREQGLANLASSVPDGARNISYGKSHDFRGNPTDEVRRRPDTYGARNAPQPSRSLRDGAINGAATPQGPTPASEIPLQQNAQGGYYIDGTAENRAAVNAERRSYRKHKNLRSGAGMY